MYISKRYQIRDILIISLIFFIYGCANIKAPEGGKKDIIPPQLVLSSPKHEQIEFRDKTVHLYFNEDIEINNLTGQLLISPFTENKYEYTVRRNRLTIEFENNFKDSTTFTLNFGKAIKDLTEGNIAENLRLTFSTGKTIDSISMSGTVVDHLTKKPSENVIVSLYNPEDTFKVDQHKPLYYTKTDKEGKYELFNIKEGTYNVYAIDDKNGNLIYNSQQDRIGYTANPTDLSKDLKDFNLSLIKIDNRPVKITQRRTKDENVEIDLNKGIDTAFVITENNEPVSSLLDNSKAKLILYNNLATTDSISVIVKGRDSLNNDFSEKAKIKFSKLPQSKNYALTTEPSDKSILYIYQDILLNTSEPISKINKELITLVSDSINKLTEVNYNLKPTQVRVQFEKSKFRNLTVYLEEGAITTTTGKINKADTLDYSIQISNDLGDISGKVITDKTNFIVELLNENYTTLAQQYGTTNFKFKNLQPSKYFIRVIVDENKNKKWDPGKFSERVEPENVIYFNEPIEVRANWEIEDIIITVPNK